jgi:phage shock protein A
VVRLLHPDRQREMTQQKIEWWHQAQAAYEAGDVEQLEVILTLCEIGESGTTAHTSASLLQRITAQVKSSLRELKRQIRDHRQEPAWNFSERTDHEVMRAALGRDLLEEVNRMRYQLRAIQEMVGRWKTAAERLKPSRRRKSQPWDLEFQF